MSRRLGVVLVAVVALALVVPAAAHAATPTTWTRPVGGAVVRPFDPPQSRFGAGHLGADLSAAPGTNVRAAGPGVVSFAGTVAGSLHVVVAHAGNLRTSYSFLASVAVHRGDTVDAGDVIGTTGGRGEHHDGSVLHFALRSGDTYVDPMALFRPIDLTAVVHLAPTSEPPHSVAESSERRSLWSGLVHDVGAVAGAVGRGTVTVGRAVANVAAKRMPVAAAVARGTARFLARHCDTHAPPANGEGGSGHRLMLVAGIESSLTGTESSLGLPTDRLGYASSEVTNFSYAKDGGNYVPAATEGPLLDAALRLRDQLRALQRREPGREVDLLAHSQGGVVVEVFLTLIYEAGDPTYPPLGTVVTLSSPLQGDPLATAIAEASPAARIALTGLDAAQDHSHHRITPLLDAPAVRDLARNSPLMQKLATKHLPFGVQVTAIGAATDVMVPGDAAGRAGAQRATEIPRSLNAHTGILTDPGALQDIRAALEDKPLPCRSLLHEVASEVAPVAIGGLEERGGQLLGGRP